MSRTKSQYHQRDRDLTAPSVLRQLGARLSGFGIRAISGWLFAVFIWLGTVVLAFVGLTEVMRIVAIAVMTGATLFACAYEWSQREKNWRGTVGFLMLTWIASAATLFFANRFVPPATPIRGPLIAANDQIPKMFCSSRGVGKSDLVMLVGNDTVIGKDQGPFTPVQVGSCPILRITQAPKGVLVDAFSYDSGNNLIFRISKNVFEGLDLFSGFLKEERPDRSTLLITDEHSHVVFAVRYLHEGVVRVWGTFKCGGTRPVQVTEDFVLIGRAPQAGRECISMKSGTKYGLLFR